MIPPGKTIGILGGGVLARATALEAARLGYRVHVYCPEPYSPAGEVAAEVVHAAYADEAQLAEFARQCDVLTCETENVPVEALWKIEKGAVLLPHWSVLEVAQNRVREKNWLRKNGFPHVPFTEVEASDELSGAVRRVGLPCFIKTAESVGGRDELMKVSDEAALAHASALFERRRLVAERFVDFRCELSVTVARTASDMRTLPVTENIRSKYVLDFSVAPARISAAVTSEAEQLARGIAERLDYTGVLTVKFFLSDRGELQVNRICPRPDACGDAGSDTCVISQYEQHVRALCGLPLADTKLHTPTACVHFVPELWSRSGVTQRGAIDWTSALAEPGAKLTLFAAPPPSTAPQVGRLTVRADSSAHALERARALKDHLLRQPGSY